MTLWKKESELAAIMKYYIWPYNSLQNALCDMITVMKHNEYVSVFIGLIIHCYKQFIKHGHHKKSCQNSNVLVSMNSLIVPYTN